MFVVINPGDYDFKSPIDEKLMTEIVENLNDLDSRITGGGASVTFQFKVNGLFEDYDFDSELLDAQDLDGASVVQSTQFSNAILTLNKRGKSGKVRADFKRWIKINRAIQSITDQFSEPTQSIARVSPSLATQSITIATPQVNTQSITFVETQRNVQSITPLGGGLVRIDLDGGAFSAKFVAGKFVLIQSATDGNNNGIFEIEKVGQDGEDNLIIRNSSGVLQTGAAGTLDLQLFSYNLTNPASSEFVVGERFLAAGHTDSNNDGLKTIDAVNNGGNNLQAYIDNGATQGGAAGTIDVSRWVYTFLSAAGTDFVVGESIFGSGHTSSNNDGIHRITALNSGGNNIVVYNESGVAQGGAAGTVDTNRWIYALLTDVSSSINVGETISAVGHDNTANDADAFEVVQINRLATNNLIIYNESGVAQGGVNGTVKHTRKLVSFSADFSADFTVNDSIAKIFNTLSSKYEGRFTVLEINRGGGSNYNIVIDVPDRENEEQPNPQGLVAMEGQTLLTTPIEIDLDSSTYKDCEQKLVANGTLRNPFIVAANSIVNFDVLEIPEDDFEYKAGDLTGELN